MTTIDEFIDAIKTRPRWPLLGLCILAILIFMGLYLLQAIDVPQAPNTISILDVRYYIDKGLFTQTPYFQYEALPTKYTHPNTVYRVIAGNNMVKWADKVLWTELELNIGRPIVVKHKITQDEYTALNQDPTCRTLIYEVQPKQNTLWVVLSISSFIGAVFTATYKTRERRTKLPPITTDAQPKPPIEPQSQQVSTAVSTPITQPKPGEELSKSIDEALRSMDTVDKWYTNENEANKELAVILKAQGFNVKYKYKIKADREVDIYIDHKFIEGKLSPPQDEVDRLLGQLKEYTEYSNEVHIVVYGTLSDKAKDRILNDIKQHYNNKVFLDYLPYPKRQRREKTKGGDEI